LGLLQSSEIIDAISNADVLRLLCTPAC